MKKDVAAEKQEATNIATLNVDEQGFDRIYFLRKINSVPKPVQLFCSFKWSEALDLLGIQLSGNKCKHCGQPIGLENIAIIRKKTGWEFVCSKQTCLAKDVKRKKPTQFIEPETQTQNPPKTNSNNSQSPTKRNPKPLFTELKVSAINFFKYGREGILFSIGGKHMNKHEVIDEIIKETKLGKRLVKVYSEYRKAKDELEHVGEAM